MKILGTVDEWLEIDPNVCLRNDSVLCDSEGFRFHKEKIAKKALYIFGIKKEKTGIVSYPATSTYSTDPMIFIGMGTICPYILKGEFNYRIATGSYYFGTGGGLNYLSDKMANDPNWYKWDYGDYDKFANS